MERFIKAAKEWSKNFDIKAKSEEAFDYPYPFWDKEMYKHNESFENLKKRLTIDRYEPVKTRSQIIGLYKENSDDSLYDAFLCTMAWGGIGVYKKDRFTDVFDTPKDTMLKTLNTIKEKIKYKDIRGAFESLQGDFKIKSVGPAFFTKYLYFLGAACEDWGDTPKPLIYDSVMVDVHAALLLSDNNYRVVSNENVDDYLDFIERMHKLAKSKDLGLESAGHLEALLFTKNGVKGRQFVRQFIKDNYLKCSDEITDTKDDLMVKSGERVLFVVNAGNGNKRLGVCNWKENPTDSDKVFITLPTCNELEIKNISYKKYGTLTHREINKWINGNDYKPKKKLMFKFIDQDGVHKYEFLKEL